MPSKIKVRLTVGVILVAAAVGGVFAAWSKLLTAPQAEAAAPSDAGASALAKSPHAGTSLPAPAPEVLVAEAGKVRVSPAVVTKPVVEKTAAEQALPDKVAAQFVSAPPKPARPRNASDDFFEQGKIPQIRITLTKPEEEKLRRDPRRFVDCSIEEDGKTTYKKVGIKLKGAAGSFRGLDDRPALTLKMKKKGERFHGMDKFHLNNSVQDDSYLNEFVSSYVFRAAGYPATRVSHARVWINKRDLGFYVLKEGFDEEFLARHFANPKGNLYDGGFCKDLDQDMEHDGGDGPTDLSDQKALLAALREGDQTKRWQLVSERLDIDAFLDFMAIEMITCHWDGYVRNRNNYRVYFNPPANKAIFLPHGMDQMFGDVNFPCFQGGPGMVAGVVMQNPEWRAKYRDRVRELAKLLDADKINAVLDKVQAGFRPVLVAMSNEQRGKDSDNRLRDLKARLVARQENIRNQIRNLPADVIAFGAQGWVPVEDWAPKGEGDAKLEQKDIDGKPHYTIQTGPSKRCTASWRKKVILRRGTYRIEAQGRVVEVKPIEGEDPKAPNAPGQGLGLRLSGGTRTNSLVGTQTGNLAQEFEVKEEQRDVDMVIELRASAGAAAVPVASVKLVKVK